MNNGNTTVLLVEDNPGDARLIRELLSEKGAGLFTLEVTDRLATALRRLGQGGVDAVLLDLALPDSAGRETFTIARAQAPTVPIIVLTGLGDESLAVRMVQEGAQDYVTKVDLNGNTLTRSIRYAIERERAEQQILKFNETLEQKVRERTAELKAANEELEAFSSSVSHDLRGPLHVIDGFSTMLEESHADVLTFDGVKYIDRIHKSVQEMAEIIEHLLRLSRLGRQELKLQWTKLDDLVKPVLEEIRTTSNGRKLEWIVESLPSAFCDPGLVRQVLVNLLSNAVKYTAKCDVAVIEIGQRDAEGEVVLFVRDNGAGFNAGSAQKLFTAFQRFHRDDEYEGTGVGLATVRRIVQRHGGRIWAESAVGEGATFYFTLEPRKRGLPAESR